MVDPAIQTHWIVTLDTIRKTDNQELAVIMTTYFGGGKMSFLPVRLQPGKR
jgi:hypothetical protein